MSSLTLENSNVQMTKFVIFNSLKGSGNSTFEFKNFSMISAELNGAQIGSFQAGNYLKIDSFVVENSSLYSDQYLNSYFLEFKMDNMTEIRGLQFYNNSMIDSISILMISRLPQHFLFVDSNFTNNSFSNSPIIRMDNFEIIEKDRKHEYSVLLLQNITLSYAQVRNSKSLFDLWSYFVLVLDSHFKNIELMSGTVFTLRGGKGIDYQLVDIDYINETFVNYPKLANLLLYSNYYDRPFELGDALELQHRFESNIFEDCTLNYDSQTDQDIDYSFYDVSLIEVTGFTYYLDYVLFIDNQFTRTNIKRYRVRPFYINQISSASQYQTEYVSRYQCEHSNTFYSRKSQESKAVLRS